MAALRRHRERSSEEPKNTGDSRLSQGLFPQLCLVLRASSPSKDATMPLDPRYPGRRRVSWRPSDLGLVMETDVRAPPPLGVFSRYPLCPRCERMGRWVDRLSAQTCVKNNTLCHFMNVVISRVIRTFFSFSTCISAKERVRLKQNNERQ